MASILDYMNKANAIDKELKTTDVAICIISTYSNKDSYGKREIVPDKTVVRYGFLETIVRCARDKFFSIKEAPGKV